MEKYNELIGQTASVRKILHWLKNPEKPILLYGPSGIGKSSVPKVIAAEENLDLIEIEPDNLESLRGACLEGSLAGNRLVVIDELERFKNLSEIFKVIDKSRYPVILIADNAYNQKFRNYIKKCELLRLRRIPVNLIGKRLLQVCEEKKIKISKNKLWEIVENSNGDLRSAIIDLENQIGQRERKVNIFKTLQIIFKGKNIEKIIQQVRQSEKDIEDIMWWVEENIPNEFENVNDIAKAFEILSRVDLLRSKIIKTGNYRFKNYMIQNIANISRIGASKKFVRYQFPKRFVRKTKYENLEELAKHLHCSQNSVKNQMSYLEIINR